MPMLQYGPGDEPIPASGYRLVSFLGRGGFGEVWKARAPGGAEVALKIIRLGSREGRKEFRALQLVKRIRHPNLMPIFGFWLKSADGMILDDATTDSPVAAPEPSVRFEKTMILAGEPTLALPGKTTTGGPTLTLPGKTVTGGPTLALPIEPAPGLPTMALPGETTPGESTPGDAAPDLAQELIIAMGLGDKTLLDRLEECRKECPPGIPPEELLGYLEDSAEAIDFLNRPVHALSAGPAAIQHCDIKPANLMIVGGSVQVCDFGLARMMNSNRATTAAGSMAYAAPEILLENKPCFSTDQYSLAITYYELKTGKLPYADDSLATILEAKRGANLDFSALSDAEQAVLRRATLRNPDERHASCRKMVAALREATSAADRPPPPRVRRSSLPLVVAFLALAVAAGGAWLAWWRSTGNLPTNETSDQPKLGQQAGGGRSTGIVPANGSADRPKLVEQESHVGSADLVPANGKNRGDHPDDGQACLERGTQALRNQDFVAAVRDLDQAAKLIPKEAKVFSRLGAAWSGQKRWDRAVESYTTAIQIEHHPLDYEARGQAYRALDKPDKALTDFQKSVELDPKNAKVYAELCDIYLDKEDAESAIREISKAVQICRDDPQANFREFSARHLRAYAYLRLGKTDDAAADLERVFDLAQSGQDRASSHELFYALSVKLAEAGRYADAGRWIKKALEFAPDEETKNSYREHLKTYSARSGG